MSEHDAPAARRVHYADFYGDATQDGATPGAPDADRPLLVVLGNCQAESLRIMLAVPQLRTVRVPAVHELTADDLPHLHRLLARTDLLVSQPVAADYRGLPLGTDQVTAQLPAGARVALVPSVRFAGLYPYHVLVHPPGGSEPPPIVPYHDLRAIAVASRGGEPDDLAELATRAPLAESLVHTVSEASREELRRRQRAHGTIEVADLFAHPTFADMRTINHPGNRILREVSRRLAGALGLADEVVDPGRPLLNGVHAPRHPVVVGVHDPDVSPESSWLVDGVAVAEDEVQRAHLAWYAAHPEVIAESVRRHRATMDLLGLGAGLGAVA